MCVCDPPTPHPMHQLVLRVEQFSDRVQSWGEKAASEVVLCGGDDGDLEFTLVELFPSGAPQ